MTGPGVSTSSMKPAEGGANNAGAASPAASESGGANPPKPQETPPKRRRRRSTAKKPAAPTEPTEEQFTALGKLAFDALAAEMTLDEYVEAMRSTVAAYDAVFGK